MFEWIISVIARLGYAGVAGLTFLENVFPPIPSEVVIPVAGLVAGRGDLQITLVIVVASIGSLAGAAGWYALGKKVGEHRVRRWVERYGKWLTISVEDVDRAQAWFRRHGHAAVFFGRLVPGVRTFVSLPAGFSAMPRVPILFYSALGTVVWTAALAYAGVLLQANLTIIGDYMNLATNILIGGLAVLLIRRYVKCWTAD